MTYTIWSNGGKFEWIIRVGENIVARSGLIFRYHGQAKRDLYRNLNVMR
jgi:hypothetical protein